MTTPRRLLTLTVVALSAIACSKNSSAAGGGGGRDPGTAISGIAVPKEISALPTKGSAGTGLAAGEIGSRRQALEADARARLATDTDYAKAATVKYVDERALSQFNILNTIFKAFGQTHYADPDNVGQGPYGAMVSWEEDRGDSQSKSIVPWVVESAMVDGKNQIHVWMLMPMGDDGSTHLIKVKMTVSEAPTQNADGSYADYGIWRIDAAMDTGGSFSAEASRDAQGLSAIAIRDAGEGAAKQTLGVLHKSASAGYGKVRYPNWNDPACMQGGCDQSHPPPAVAVAYRYDADLVALREGGLPPLYKDRVRVVDVVQRYGLFDADGNDVTKLRRFGFPLQCAGPTGNRYGYYGAWQGRHQVWGNGKPVDPGTAVTRQSWGKGAPAESYTVSQVFKGVLVKRTLVPATIADIQDIVVNTWVNEGVNITYSAASDAWTSCVNPHWDGVQQKQVCSSQGPFELSNLVGDPALNENVWISGCGQSGCFNLVYTGAAFHLATQSPGQPPQPTDQIWTPQDNANLWVNINKPVYFYWNGTAWKKKLLVSLDQFHNPTFAAASSDTTFSLAQDQDYYLNDMGTNYVVRLHGADYSVKVEQQAVANPVNAADFVLRGTVFKRAWNGDTQTTFTFDPNTLQIVYATVGDQDKASGHVSGDALDSNEWSLVALVGGIQAAEMYNWEYPNSNPNPGDSHGTQQFLVDGAGQFVILHDPIRLAPVALAGAANLTKKYALQFDGSWVGGLPQIWNDLQAAHFDMTAAIAAKVVNIPDGQQVVDAADGAKIYTFKQLQVTEYLLPAGSAPSLDLGAAEALDLDALAPPFADPGLGAMPDVPVKYSEGTLVP